MNKEEMIPGLRYRFHVLQVIKGRAYHVVSTSSHKWAHSIAMRELRLKYYEKRGIAL